jgi:hypothetical protein
VLNSLDNISHPLEDKLALTIHLLMAEEVVHLLEEWVLVENKDLHLAKKLPLGQGKSHLLQWQSNLLNLIPRYMPNNMNVLELMSVCL